MLKIGDIVGDLKVINVIHSTKEIPYIRYEVECLICHRKRFIRQNTLQSKSLSHKYCKTELNKKDKIDLKFYYIWKNAKPDMYFVDFYDKFYSFYKESLQLNPIKFVIENYNGIYLIPIVNNPHTRIYDGHVYLNEPYLDNFCSIWEGLRDRTTNPNNEFFNNYGGRNINSDAFKYFNDFYKLMYQSYLDAIKEYPNEKISIDRIDVNKNYSKENCRWIPKKWQNGNQTTNKWICAIGNNHIYLTKNIKKFSEVFHISYSCIRSNLKGITNYVYDTWKFTYIDISKYENLPLNKINVIFDITNYPNYKIVYEDK